MVRVTVERNINLPKRKLSKKQKNIVENKNVNPTIVLVYSRRVRTIMTMEIFV